MINTKCKIKYTLVHNNVSSIELTVDNRMNNLYNLDIYN